MVITLPKISLKPIKTISPSQYFSLKSCSLRGILSENRQEHLIPIHPSAMVGELTHKMLQMAILGQITDKKTIISVWDNICKQIEQGMKNSPLERHLVPLELSANNFEVKKNQVFEIISNLIKITPGLLIQKTGQKVEAEKLIEDSEMKVRGKIDLIRYTEAGAEIIDYKTGSVIDANSENNSLKLEYQLQLKLYAALYYSVKKEWPIRLILVGIDQKEYEVQFNKKECIQLFESAKKDLDELNRCIAEGLPPEHFARPSPDSCKYCTYRPVCTAYWKQRDDSGNWPSDISGEIKENKILGNGLRRIVVENPQHRIAIRGLSSDRNGFLSLNVTKVVFCNLCQDPVKNSYFENMMTVGYAIE